MLELKTVTFVNVGSEVTVKQEGIKITLFPHCVHCSYLKLVSVTDTMIIATNCDRSGGMDALFHVNFISASKV